LRGLAVGRNDAAAERARAGRLILAAGQDAVEDVAEVLDATVVVELIDGVTTNDAVAFTLAVQL